MHTLFAGIDAGGTRTTCALLDTHGNLRGTGEGPAANFTNEEPERVRAAIESSFREALAGAGARREAVASVYVCMAGYAPEKDEARARALLGPVFAPASSQFGRDLDAALVAVCGAGSGLVVIAGTGSVAFGRNAGGETWRCGGWGYLVGDEGSGFFLGSQAIKRTLHALDGRGQRTPLVEMVLREAGVTDAVSLDKRIYKERWRPAEFACYAPLVFTAARAGDPIALDLLDRAARDLALQAQSVVSRLGLLEEPCGLSGGVWRSGALIREPFTRYLHAAAPRIPVIDPPHTPAEGAALAARSICKVNDGGL